MRLTKRQERLAETTGIYAAARLAIEEYLRDRGEIW